MSQRKQGKNRGESRGHQRKKKIIPDWVKSLLQTLFYFPRHVEGLYSRNAKGSEHE